MADSLELAPPPLQPAHRRQVNLLSGLMHAGLALVGVSAIWTLQPAMTPKHWAAFLLVALAMLICAAATRGRGAFGDGGRLLTALGAALVFRLARDPQLGAIPAIGDNMPGWAAMLAPGLATFGLLLAVIAGFLYVRTLDNYLGHGHMPPFLTALNWSAALILVLSVLTFLTLRRLYELDTAYLALLVAGTIQYVLLLRLTLCSSGRIAVGAAPQVYLAVAILGAFVHNFVAGMVMGGEA